MVDDVTYLNFTAMEAPSFCMLGSAWEWILSLAAPLMAGQAQEERQSTADCSRVLRGFEHQV